MAHKKSKMKDHDVVGHSMKMMKGREGMGHGFVTGHDEGVGRGDFANMPQHPIMKPFPPATARRGGMLDDTITNIDAVQHECEAQSMRHLSNQK